MKKSFAKACVIFLAGYLLAWNMLLTIAVRSDSTAFAIMCMSWGLAVAWIFIGGTIMYRSRERVRAFVHTIPLAWQLKFVLFATLLALAEEVITVTLTNLAPLFGSEVGVSYITASANYFDVVLFHSVIVFIPLFIAWAIVLTRYKLSTFAVFLLFGLTGILAEISLGGPQQMLGFAQWIFVYGLMVYLPAYCVPTDRAARSPGFFAHLGAIPLTLLIALPVIAIIVYFITGVLDHPSIHFVN